MNVLKRFSVSILLLLVAEAFLLLFFPPSLILEPNIAAGGDTPSHFLSALAMREKLRSPFSPVSWAYGSFAGYPLFLHYFPLPFFLMAIISLAVPIAIAFKLVTLLAIIPLPAAVYYALRRLGSRDPVPGLGAVFSLSFLFMTENSMWGGNINSTLAGEFAFGISFILSIVYTGRLYRDVPLAKSLFANALIEACVALCNGYPLLQAGTGSSYFALRGKGLRYLIALHATAFGLAAFWLLPLLWRMPWNSPFSHFWNFQSRLEVFPPVLWPAAAGALALLPASCRNCLRRGISGTAASLRSSSGQTPEQYLWYQFGISLLLFGCAPALGLVDIRFLPFAQICIVMLGAIGWGKIFSRLPRPGLWAMALSAAIIALALAKAPPIDTWIQWNYTGMETKPLSRSFLQVNAYLKGDENSPRVVDEHSETANAAGTVRAFEMLPHYSGRSTLEGLYMQSSVSAPFVFLIQSELTQSPSCPLAQYRYSRPDVTRAAAHLRLYNVSQIVAVSDDISNALDASSDYELEAVFPPYRVYRVENSPGSYVEPLAYMPFRISPSGWKARQYAWLRKSSLRVPLVVAEDNARGAFIKTLQPFHGDPEDLPEIPMRGPAEPVRAAAHLGRDSVTVSTSHPGHPLWLKVSYHPDWKIAEGDGELYPASPAFMLLVPKTAEVVLRFDTGGGVFLWGKILGLIALAVPAALWCRRRTRGNSAGKGDGSTAGATSPRSFTFPANAALFAAFVLLGAIALASTLTRERRDPILLYEAATMQFNAAGRAMLAAAPHTPGTLPLHPPVPASGVSAVVDACIEEFPESSVFDHCVYYRMQILLAEARYSEVRSLLEAHLAANPDTRILSDSLAGLGEASLHLGKRREAEEFFRRALRTWPEDRATRKAGLLLASITEPEALFAEALERLEAGDFLDAYVLLRSLCLSPDPDLHGRSTLGLAYCCYYMNRWEEASNLFLQWLADHFDSPDSIEVQEFYRQCQIIGKLNREWVEGPGGSSSPPADRGWFLRLFERRNR